MPGWVEKLLLELIGKFVAPIIIEYLKKLLDPENLDKIIKQAGEALVCWAKGQVANTQNKVDDEFFAAGTPCEGSEEEFLPEGRIKSNFLCNLGYGDPARLHERLPRLDFSEACKLL